MGLCRWPLSEVQIAALRGTTKCMRLIGKVVANAIVVMVLRFLTTLFLYDHVPVNLLSLVICVIRGSGRVGNPGTPLVWGGLLEDC